ncbi:hypothetical protein EVAR_24957_1 [Eumeta japonica]|uniref:Uncharacterized protein n=1 Tax=Eumeta variegata TaxID=151549 RepID=A0A4C1ZX43_EUMVA|nr:hypothetical protein EVAR_24957_1 [Eumeta japonica]
MNCIAIEDDNDVKEEEGTPVKKKRYRQKEKKDENSIAVVDILSHELAHFRTTLHPINQSFLQQLFYSYPRDRQCFGDSSCGCTTMGGVDHLLSDAVAALGVGDVGDRRRPRA